jgi:hypothetical protein
MRYVPPVQEAYLNERLCPEVGRPPILAPQGESQPLLPLPAVAMTEACHFIARAAKRRQEMKTIARRCICGDTYQVPWVQQNFHSPLPRTATNINYFCLFNIMDILKQIGKKSCRT